ncbi:MAG: PAS domain-containing protein [Bacteroidetes bacterium]|nr:PAS domain-containing protein [Bacteroidota bacterium]
MNFNFIDFLDAAVIVCDTDCTITYLNRKALMNYAAEGGAALIGKNLRDCHNENSMAKIRNILKTGEKNVYTIEKKGRKKLIYQAPWFEEGAIKGIVEFSMEIPFEIEHFVRT